MGAGLHSLRKLFAKQPSLHPTRRPRLWFYILTNSYFLVFCFCFFMEAKLAVLIFVSLPVNGVDIFALAYWSCVFRVVIDQSVCKALPPALDILSHNSGSQNREVTVLSCIGKLGTYLPVNPTSPQCGNRLVSS